VSYWTAWQPPAPGDDEELWSTRIATSTQGGLPAIAARYAETAGAVLVSAGRVRGADLVRRQGRVLRVDDLLSTLVVEAAVHHLDLVRHLNRPGPGAEPLAEVRRVLDRLELGPGVLRFPLFG
jgi:hypothetical protein